MRGRTPEEGSRTSGLFGTALRAADAVADASTAAMLLHPFRVENLTDAHVTSFAKIADGYGHQWTADLLRTWFGGDQPAWAYGGGRERPQWVADFLPGLCARLRAEGSAGAVAAQRLLDLAWEWISKDIRSGLGLSLPKICAAPSARFLEDRSRRTFEWPLAKDGRQHVHSRIDGAELPISHVTRRQGRPYTLVLNKTDVLFSREREAQIKDERI